MHLANYYTLLLVVAPFAIPRALNYGIRLASSRNAGRNKANAASTAQNIHLVRASDAPPTTRISYARKLVLCGGVIIFSIFQLLYRRPFNLFTSLQDGLSLTTHTSQLQSLLRWRGLSARWLHVPALLSSLEARLIYAHFGQATFIGCHGLCRPDSTGDHLAYATIRILRSYVASAIVLCLANPRWKNWLATLAGAGFTAEVFWLATSEIRAKSDGTANCLSDRLFYYRHAGVALISAFTSLLPSRCSQMQISQDEANILTGIQALNQKQDSIQMRIRAIQTAQAAKLGAKNKTTATCTASSLNEGQKQELLAWLEGILALSSAGAYEASSSTASPSAQHSGSLRLSASLENGNQDSAENHNNMHREATARESQDPTTLRPVSQSIVGDRVAVPGAIVAFPSPSSPASLPLFSTTDSGQRTTELADPTPFSAFSTETDEMTMHTSRDDLSHDMSVVGDIASYTIAQEFGGDTSLLAPTKGDDAFIADSGATKELQLRLNNAIHAKGSSFDESPSGSDSPIMSPTPATNLPPSFELIASSLLAASTGRKMDSGLRKPLDASEVAVKGVEEGMAALDIRSEHNNSAPGVHDTGWMTVESRKKQTHR